MKDLSWETLSSEYLYKETWFTMRKDVCRTREGKVIDPYYVYEFPTWVIAVALTKDGRFIVERQYRHALGVTDHELPGGCVDATDSSLEAAIRRELLEETGYSFGPVEYLAKTSANPSTNSNWAHIFLATEGVLSHEQRLDHNEEIEVYLYTVDELRQLLRNNGMVQSMHVTALFYGLQKLGQMQF
ncbi:MAG TPA: NUDIX hydrolase [Puia sp.]|nr:NUDIX hydrolase [Puia sp.]